MSSKGEENRGGDSFSLRRRLMISGVRVGSVDVGENIEVGATPDTVSNTYLDRGCMVDEDQSCVSSQKKKKV